MAATAIRWHLRQMLAHYAPRQDPALLEDFVFVTGVGHHSPQKGPVLRPALQEVLAGFDPPLPTHEVQGNPGRLRIDKADIQRWCDHQLRSSPESDAEVHQEVRGEPIPPTQLRS